MPQDAKNGDFRELFPISTPSFPTTCIGFEPPKSITLHLIVFKMLESIIRQGVIKLKATNIRGISRLIARHQNLIGNTGIRATISCQGKRI
jgi:hypothetical protein